jgi:integrase/recombinase XerD
MNKTQQIKFDSLYQEHVNALHRQGKAKTTIDVAYRDVSKEREQERKRKLLLPRGTPY